MAPTRPPSAMSRRQVVELCASTALVALLIAASGLALAAASRRRFSYTAPTAGAEDDVLNALDKPAKEESKSLPWFEWHVDVDSLKFTSTALSAAWQALWVLALLSMAYNAETGEPRGKQLRRWLSPLCRKNWPALIRSNLDAACLLALLACLCALKLVAFSSAGAALMLLYQGAGSSKAPGFLRYTMASLNYGSNFLWLVGTMGLWQAVFHAAGMTVILLALRKLLDEFMESGDAEQGNASPQPHQLPVAQRNYALAVSRVADPAGGLCLSIARDCCGGDSAHAWDTSALQQHVESAAGRANAEFYFDPQLDTKALRNKETNMLRVRTWLGLLISATEDAAEPCGVVKRMLRRWLASKVPEARKAAADAERGATQELLDQMLRGQPAAVCYFETPEALSAVQKDINTHPATRGWLHARPAPLPGLFSPHALLRMRWRWVLFGLLAALFIFMVCSSSAWGFLFAIMGRWKDHLCKDSTRGMCGPPSTWQSICDFLFITLIVLSVVTLMTDKAFPWAFSGLRQAAGGDFDTMRLQLAIAGAMFAYEICMIFVATLTHGRPSSVVDIWLHHGFFGMVRRVGAHAMLTSRYEVVFVGLRITLMTVGMFLLPHLGSATHFVALLTLWPLALLLALLAAVVAALLHLVCPTRVPSGMEAASRVFSCARRCVPLASLLVVLLTGCTIALLSCSVTTLLAAAGVLLVAYHTVAGLVMLLTGGAEGFWGRLAAALPNLVTRLFRWFYVRKYTPDPDHQAGGHARPHLHTAEILGAFAPLVDVASETMSTIAPAIKLEGAVFNAQLFFVLLFTLQFVFAPGNSSLGRWVLFYVRRSLWSCLLQLLFTGCALVSKGLPPHICLPAMLAAQLCCVAYWWLVLEPRMRELEALPGKLASESAAWRPSTEPSAERTAHTLGLSFIQLRQVYTPPLVQRMVDTVMRSGNQAAIRIVTRWRAPLTAEEEEAAAGQALHPA